MRAPISGAKDTWWQLRSAWLLLPGLWRVSQAHDGVSVAIAAGMLRGGAALVVLAALLLRCFVATFPHSGEATPPKYGDYEVRQAA